MTIRLRARTLTRFARQQKRYDRRHWSEKLTDHMSRELPPLNALRAFEATARLGSVNRAAQELHVTHGAISRQLRALEDALLEFAGSVMVISHDRWFLDRIATHILAFEGDSQVTFFDGNYQEYEADKIKRLGEEAARPKRLRYKPISR